MRKSSLYIFLLLTWLTYTIQTQSQWLCQPPTSPGPVFWQSVDPPVFTWVPAAPDPQHGCYGVNGKYEILCPFTCDYTCLDLFTDPNENDSFYVMPNSSWTTLNAGTNYCWAIQSLAWPHSYSSAGLIVRLAAALPWTSLISPANGSTGISVTPLMSWNTVTGAATYRVTVYSAKRLNVVAFDSTTSGTSVQIPAGKLNSNTVYWWRVKPYNTGGEGPYCDPFVFTTGQSAIPPAPVLSSPANNSTGLPLTNTLSWGASAGATSYRLQVSLNSGFTTVLLDDSLLTGTSRSVSGLSPLTTYYWRVSAKNSSGISGWSAVWNFRTLGPGGQITLLMPPNNAVNIPTTYTFIWSRALEQEMHLTISKYWLELTTDTVTNANYMGDSTITDTLRSVGGMLPGSSYYWRVKAKNQIGWGNFSPRSKFTTIPPLPSVPVLIAPANNSTGQSLTPLLDWQLVQYAASYRLQLSTDTLFSVIRLDSTISVDSIRIPAGKLTNNITYYWRVNASNAAGTSSWSTVWHFTTLYLAINNLQGEVPKTFNLYVNFPNPFNPTTKIRFDIPATSYVSMQIFDVTGRSVSEVLNSTSMLPGAYEVIWDASSFASGVYYYRISAGDFTDVRKMVLIK